MEMELAWDDAVTHNVSTVSHSSSSRLMKETSQLAKQDQ
jgi:hypothetical protein